ncbi:Adenine nucleotide alpha hydrolases-like superfamily protein [Prunus dulcis]|uniref:Adenine nucleotide alpha hydrolases-like superfamily protein n=1 Tax=Prunus dulcis TaxID=3755 RepID=A0A4Y1R9C2_PRUDU|nr:Adenine nucleotide alpha hydrolases-like superfamily protein [Prunus dulcis]
MLSNRRPALPSEWDPTSGAQRRIGIAVDLSDESAFAVKWAVQNYLRPGDAVILLHVRPTSVLYGADWGATDVSIPEDQESQQKLEDDFDNFTVTKANDLAKPLEEAKTPYKIHIVKDHDMKERLCLEVERLGLSAVVMGSRGFGASKTTSKARLGSVSDYCVHHCVCPVIVVRFSDEKDENDVAKQGKFGCPVVREEEPEFHDALEKGMLRTSLSSSSRKEDLEGMGRIQTRHVEQMEMVKSFQMMFIKYSWFYSEHITDKTALLPLRDS